MLFSRAMSCHESERLAGTGACRRWRDISRRPLLETLKLMETLKLKRDQ